ncbi:flagellar hook-associated protein 3 FlgL [Kushneria sinocarnis]|uniref:Flagellar hook-associated protein 3 FlgL n=1 Tax=Kushneria sinocarnis TaxID=595502 RepID=A0A420WY59_9GAMM|nr:flagellar hook-associated protein FlgL [Kushneria sinocarnis]RKR06090.1 flagellar hook-associated protein 3 FlgL [Kushneria sinocarnis]
MRISTSMMFELSRNAMQDRQSDLSEIGLQLSTGKRIATPSSDPRAAGQVLLTQQANAQNSQFENSRITAQQQLATQDSVLDSVTNLITRAKSLIVQAGNGTMSDVDRQSNATELEGLYQEALGLANSQDGNGNYVFAGSQTDQPAFVEEAGGVTYNGDDVVQSMRVDASRNMKINRIGSEVFDIGASGDDPASSLFNSLKSAIDVLNQPLGDGADGTVTSEQYRATIDRTNRQLDQSLDNVLTVRSSIGSNLNEIDALDEIGNTRSLNYETQISSLQDLDYSEAISRYSVSQVGLQASQQLFTRVQELSLFKML